uniref:Uncharacterized protein n=1 Tax=Avena sativa TaxID=4498 RepID=A0ACD5VY60_AVESA
MLLKWNAFSSGPVNAIHPFILVLLGIVYVCIPATAIVAVPSSNCYTFDSDSHLVDFTHMVGTNFEYNEKFHQECIQLYITLHCHYQGSISTDLVVQLCKDVQRRSQAV